MATEQAWHGLPFHDADARNADTRAKLSPSAGGATTKEWSGMPGSGKIPQANETTSDVANRMRLVWPNAVAMSPASQKRAKSLLRAFISLTSATNVRSPIRPGQRVRMFATKFFAV